MTGKTIIDTTAITEVTSLVRGYPTGYYKATYWTVNAYGEYGIHEHQTDTARDMRAFIEKARKDGATIAKQVESNL